MIKSFRAPSYFKDKGIMNIYRALHRTSGQI